MKSNLHTLRLLNGSKGAKWADEWTVVGGKSADYSGKVVNTNYAADLYKQQISIQRQIQNQIRIYQKQNAGVR